MLNHVCIMGRLARDPELRTTGSGKHVASFSVAVERDFSADGKRECDFLECVAWGKTGEFVSRYFTKGKMICVEGRVQNRDWQDKDGNKRRSTEIIASGVHFCGDSANGAQPTQQPQQGGFSGWQPNYQPPAGWQPAPATEGVPVQADFSMLPNDEELPF